MFLYNFAQLPYISMTGKVNEKNGWSHSGRQMIVNLLVIFHSGECCFQINGTEYTFTKGDIALVPKNTLYRPHTATSCEYTFFHFDGDLIPCEHQPADIPPSDSIPPGNPFYGYKAHEESNLLFDYKMTMGNQQQNIELMLHKSINTQISQNKKMQILLALQFSEMMFYISQSFCESFQGESSMPSSVNFIISYIKENYMHNITLDDICQNTSFSKQYCMRLFKKYMHMTINNYILNLRMRHAAYLLRSTYMNVNQAADYLGFSNVSYFSRVFKKYYGVAPSAYFE